MERRAHQEDRQDRVGGGAHLRGVLGREEVVREVQQPQRSVHPQSSGQRSHAPPAHLVVREGERLEEAARQREKVRERRGSGVAHHVAVEVEAPHMPERGDAWFGVECLGFWA